MRQIWSVGIAISLGVVPEAYARTTSEAEAAIIKYCEPVVAGSALAGVNRSAQGDGFGPEVISGRPALRKGMLFVMISDTPPVCIVQAPSDMTFQQGLELVDAWAANNTPSARGAATRGPDGAPVRLWSSLRRKMSLLVSEQSNLLGQKVLNFILMPTPPGMVR